jgi:uncharacterized protein YjbI with pentapeptide repeats
MDPMVESALISAAATLVGIGGTVAVAIVGFRSSRSTNQATIDAAKATTDETIDAARDTNKATIDAAHADVRRTLDTTRDGQIADLYGRAIDQLGSKKLDIRIGGIYALERVARESARDHPTVVEVLTAFVRQNSRKQWPPPDPGGQEQERSTRPDVQAAITVVGRRDRERDIRPIDLTGAVLAGADLGGADLSRAVLAGADLTGANLLTANLALAYLGRANLTGAILTRAVLAGARLTEANLTEANLFGADLGRADLGRADLTRAYLWGSDLTHARLTEANLTEANLGLANLTQANLALANLTGTTFFDTILTDVGWPEGAPVPEGWKLDANSGRMERAGTGPGPAAAEHLPGGSSE